MMVLDMQFQLNFPQFFETFKYMFYGMAGVFVVTAVIMLSIKLLGVAFQKKEKKDKQKDPPTTPDHQREE